MSENVLKTFYETEYIHYEHTIIKNPKNDDFQLHTHKNELEILIFIRGNAEYRVEGEVYKLEPYDTIIASSNEMHRVIHLSETDYERIVIMVKPDFFINNDCVEYNKIFYDRPIGCNNHISHKNTKNSDFCDCIERMEKYIKENTDNKSVVKGTFFEMLYILNKCRNKPQFREPQSNKYIQQVISYINEHLTENITLNNLSEIFFVNKSYLFRIFKKHTGYTVNKYITHKRILLVRELCAKNLSITQASIEAGFGNYSNFYKMYLNEVGTPPKNELKNKML